jgi:hypothetical protein
MSRDPRSPDSSRGSVAFAALSGRPEYEYGWLIRLDRGAYKLGTQLHASKAMAQAVREEAMAMVHERLWTAASAMSPTHRRERQRGGLSIHPIFFGESGIVVEHINLE